MSYYSIYDVLCSSTARKSCLSPTVNNIPCFKCSESVNSSDFQDFPLFFELLVLSFKKHMHCYFFLFSIDVMIS